MSTQGNDDEYASARIRMVETQLRRRGINDERVLAAMYRVPRHLFVPASAVRRAYEDTPLPIGHGQTISQPYMVASMTAALALEPDDHVLEVGTGSAYQTAVLCELAERVTSIERILELTDAARLRLATLGYHAATVAHGDGSVGWLEEAPYDAIVVTAGAPRFPRSLVDQLRVDGRLVVPVGSRDLQLLKRAVKRSAAGDLETVELDLCRFVDLIGAEGWGD